MGGDLCGPHTPLQSPPSNVFLVCGCTDCMCLVYICCFGFSMGICNSLVRILTSHWMGMNKKNDPYFVYFLYGLFSRFKEDGIWGQ